MENGRKWAGVDLKPQTWALKRAITHILTPLPMGAELFPVGHFEPILYKIGQFQLNFSQLKGSVLKLFDSLRIMPIKAGRLIVFLVADD